MTIGSHYEFVEKNNDVFSEIIIMMAIVSFSKFYFLTWAPTNCLMAIFPEGPRGLSPGVLQVANCAYENRSTRQPNHFELRLHCTMSFEFHFGF